MIAGATTSQQMAAVHARAPAPPGPQLPGTESAKFNSNVILDFGVSLCKGALAGTGTARPLTA